MLKRLALAGAVLLAGAYPAAADTLVNWFGSGEVTFSSQRFPFVNAPPVGTPLSVSLSFDPNSSVATAPGVAGAEGCRQINFSSSFTLGDYTYTGSPGSYAFTHAQLPGSNCNATAGGPPDGGFTQFGIQGIQTPPGAPWDLTGKLLFISYRDLLVRDAFPAEPTTSGAFVFLIDPNELINFYGDIDLRALDATTAVPEPGTLALLTLGLGAAFKSRRRIQEMRR